MTLHRISPLLLLLGILPFAACDNADPGGGNGNCNNGTFTATAAGSAFDAECIQFTFSNGVLALGAITNLDGSDGPTQRQINLTLPDARAGQSYAFGPGGSSAIAVYGDVAGTNPDPNALYTANLVVGSGAVTVDAVSASGARGTFSFTARNNAGQTVSVASGAFDVTE